jgi:diguanylate cyclase (GGDEF)-like protein
MLVLGIALLATAIGVGVRERSQSQLELDHALRQKTTEQARILEEYFQRARSILLLTAANPAFENFYELPGNRVDNVRSHGTAVRETEDALAYLERLYPGSIGEACFIDRGGPENSRVVNGIRARFSDLSPDESRNPFFRPTFSLAPGQVYQARPYVSPDTHEWVVSNSTPLAGPTGLSPAIVHFEVTVESFRREAAALGGKYEISIVDGETGEVVIDSERPQRLRARLGVAGAHFVTVLHQGSEAGLVTIDARRSAFQRLRRFSGNSNDWWVVATNPHPTGGLLHGVGPAPMGMGMAALLLLVVCAGTFRNARRVLERAADTDSLTRLGNRRKLMGDLARTCAQAERSERFAVILFDLDGFKLYNDTFGHGPGDVLLARLGKNLADSMVGRGEAYRLGGDEFCVIAPITATEDAARAAEIGAEALSEHGEAFTIAASRGLVLIPDEAHDPRSVLALADLRMYSQKQGARSGAARQATDALVRALEERSPALGPHVADVAQLAEAVGRRLGLTDDRRHVLQQAAELHDVGKFAIPDSVLEKQGPLTDEEWDLVRQHTVIGERILVAAPALKEVSAIVRATHERYDGAGYPDELETTNIPLEARIIAAADAYCAMTTLRSYRPAMSRSTAILELQRCRGTQFDPRVVDALVAELTAEGASENGRSGSPNGVPRDRAPLPVHRL